MHAHTRTHTHRLWVTCPSSTKLLFEIYHEIYFTQITPKLSPQSTSLPIHFLHRAHIFCSDLPLWHKFPLSSQCPLRKAMYQFQNPDYSIIKNLREPTGMVQWLRVLVVPVEDQSWVPSIQVTIGVSQLAVTPAAWDPVSPLVSAETSSLSIGFSLPFMCIDSYNPKLHMVPSLWVLLSVHLSNSIVLE